MIKLEFVGNYGTFEHQTLQSIGADIPAQEHYLIGPDDVAKISTGLYITESNFIPFPMLNRLLPFLAIKSRSSLSNKKIFALEATIDADYREEIKVQLHNCSNEPFAVFPGDRIAQIIGLLGFQNAPVNNTIRSGGFGSTGI